MNARAGSRRGHQSEEDHAASATGRSSCAGRRLSAGAAGWRSDCAPASPSSRRRRARRARTQRPAQEHAREAAAARVRREVEVLDHLEHDGGQREQPARRPRAEPPCHCRVPSPSWRRASSKTAVGAEHADEDRDRRSPAGGLTCGGMEQVVRVQRPQVEEREHERHEEEHDARSRAAARRPRGSRPGRRIARARADAR